MVFVPKKRGKLAIRLFRHRKADIMHEIYFLMFQVLLVLMVAFALFQYTNSVATDLGFEKRLTAIDVGMLTTAVFFAPGTLKHDYYAVDFAAAIDLVFSNSLIDVKERDKKLSTLYWWLSDRNLEPLDGTVKLEATSTAPNFTYYKAGRQAAFSGRSTNPLQLTCPVVNTTVTSWESKKVFIAKVLVTDKDNSDAELPANRLATVLPKRSNQLQMQVSGKGSAPVSGSDASLISAIPGETDIIIGIGDSGERRESGSLVVYVPVNENLLQARKLACFIVNDLLTSASTVYYVQVMPVYVASLNKTSPLRVFSEISNKKQLMVFLDLSTFSKSEVNIDNIADAVIRAIKRFYGVSDLTIPSAATFNYSSSTAASSQASASGSSADTYEADATYSEESVDANVVEGE